MPRRTRSRFGNATLEFTLVGIPLVFVLISTFEMARGMWIYHTLAYAVKEGVRYTIVRGQNSPKEIPLSTICNYIVQQGPGLIARDLNLQFTSSSGTLPSKSTYYSAGSGGSNSACPSTPVWPPNGTNVVDNQPGQTITINATYPFQSSIAIFWPGAGRGMQFPAVTFPAQASEVMQF